MDYLRSLVGSLRALLMASAATGALPSAAHAQSVDPEVSMWEQVVREGTPDAFQQYLDAYPFGQHAQEAFESLIVGALGSQSIDSIEPAAGGGPSVDVTPLGDLY